MRDPLPPLRLTGALALRDGALSQRTVALAGGRISSGPFPAVDLSGYLILPGIVDLGNETLERHIGQGDLETALLSAARDLAAAGVTTGALVQEWGWDRHASPELAEAIAQALARLDRPFDMRLHMHVETGLPARSERLIHLAETGALGFVSFHSKLSRRLAWADTDPAAFAQWARARDLDPAALLDQMRAAYDRRAETPRRLCTLAETFDSAGVLYGSAGDPDGETRETYSILGAKICADPAVHGAAAVAKAVGDPVILPASRFIGPDQSQALRLLTLGKCQAIYSGNYTAPLAQIAFSLTDLGACDFARAWDLISARPAQIMRLPDRGVIAQGKRADLTIVNAQTRQVEATISRGRVTQLCGDIVSRFLAASEPRHIAAE